MKLHTTTRTLKKIWVILGHISHAHRIFTKYWGALLLVAISITMAYFSAISIANQMSTSSTEAIPRPARVYTGEFTMPANVFAQAPGKPSPLPNTIFPDTVKTYTVQSGDSLTSIAVKVGMNEKSLKKLNNIVLSNKLRTGQKLLYYTPPGVLR